MTLHHDRRKRLAMNQKAQTDSYERTLAWPLSIARSAYRRISRVILNPDEVVLKQIMNRGSRLLVFQNEDIGRRLIVMKKFEDDELDFCLKHVSSGDTCIDVGGNVGYYAIPFAKTTGPDGLVISIEPLYRNALVIRLAAELNGFRNVDVIQAAAVDVPQTITMHVPNSDSAYAHISNTTSISSDIQKIDGLTIDSIIQDRPTGRVAVLKVDVEGAEMMALKGASDLFSDPGRRPRLIMAELVPAYLARFNSTIEDVFEFMSALNFSAFRLHEGKLVPYVKADKGNTCNVFFKNPS